jgi:hypothetical protein
MTTLGKRLCVVGPCLLLGALCTGWYAIAGCPSGWSWGDRLEAWAYMLSGPVLLVIQGGGPVPGVVGGTVCLGWLGLPAMAAHPIRPNPLTAALTVVGSVLWFASGIITIIDAVWGA